MGRIYVEVTAAYSQQLTTLQGRRRRIAPLSFPPTRHNAGLIATRWPEMNLHDDFSLRVVALAADASWTPSPQAGVDRLMLDRVGAEVARATSIVRYQPGSSFERHVHGAHKPSSQGGCLQFVKLRQFAADDLKPLRIETHSGHWRQGMVPGLTVLPLHSHDGVDTALVRWAPQTRFNTHVHPGGEEILVLEGVFSDEGGSYPAGSWLRSPRWSRHTPFTGPEGALIYVKVGQLGAELMAL